MYTLLDVSFKSMSKDLKKAFALHFYFVKSVAQYVFVMSIHAFMSYTS